MSFDHRAFLATLTELPGVYRMLGEGGVVLYVGKAKNLKKRVASYFRDNLSSPRIALMVSQIVLIEVTATRTEAEALLLENNLIKSLCPRYNILFRDDKSYPYISLGKERYPRLGFFRGNPDRKADYFGPYPSSWAVRDSIHLLQKMFRLRTCEESVFSNRSRPCLLYQIKRCSGPCVEAISEIDYAKDVQYAAMFLAGRQSEVIGRLSAAMEDAAQNLEFEHAAALRDKIQSLRQVQEKQYVSSSKGEDVDIVVGVKESGLTCVNLAMVRGGRHLGDRAQFPVNAEETSLDDVVDAFVRQHYAIHPVPGRVLVAPMIPEEDGRIGIGEVVASLAGRQVPVSEPKTVLHRAWVEMALQNARLAIASRKQTAGQQELRLSVLREILAFSEPIMRIECFDISHTQGEATVASCVVYHGNGMRKSDYRRFNISGIVPGDDYAAIRQAVYRRYERLANSEEGARPDIVLIDGGRGQLNAAQDALNELGLPELAIIGVAKGEARKPGLETLIFPGEGKTLQLPPDSPALHLIQEIRDEAHRFAITGHRAKRAKARNTSRLESLPGIGPARRKALVAQFGGLPGVLNATVDQLAAVPGISKAQAEKIYAALH